MVPILQKQGTTLFAPTICPVFWANSVYNVDPAARAQLGKGGVEVKARSEGSRSTDNFLNSTLK